MGHIDVNGVHFSLPDGRPLLRDVSLRVGEGAKVALIGPNGTGKTTLTKIIAGDLAAHDGAITRSGGLGIMRQFIGKVRDESTVRDLLLSVAPSGVRAAAAEIDRAELAMMEHDEEADQLAYAQSLVDWGDAGGYAYETLWDECTVAALGLPFEKAQWRRVDTLSGGEQKRLVLEALLRGARSGLERRHAEPEDRSLHQPRPGTAQPGGDSDCDPGAERRGEQRVGSPRGIRDVPTGARGPERPA